jgi:inner membrane protein
MTTVTVPTTGLRTSPTLKLMAIAAIVLLLQIPLLFVNAIRAERFRLQKEANVTLSAERIEQIPAVQGHRMVERSLKYGVLVMALVFAAFFLFEVLQSLRLHVVHYTLVGAAICLFYLALLALGEILAPPTAYIAAAGASTLMICLYSSAILRSRPRALVIGGLQVGVHTVLFMILQMEKYALLAGTAALFVVLGTIMYLTRGIDWSRSGQPEAAPKA